MARQGNKTLVYSPDIQVHIATRNHGVIDVSRDIVRGSVSRRVNEVSTFNLVIDNRRNKYTGVISRQDRITIHLKRIKWVQVFSGYVSSVPLKSAYPTTANISGHCTLKRIRDTYWDPGLHENQSLVIGETPLDGPDHPDGGAAQILMNLLTGPGRWDKDKIHIQALPVNYTDFIRNYMPDIDPGAVEQRIIELLGGTGIISGEALGSANSSSVDKVLQIAQSEVGYQEGANDANKFGQWYGLNNQPWCSIFVSWVADKASLLNKVIPRHSLTSEGLRWFQSRGLVSRGGGAQRGDIFYEGANGEKHAGFVKEVLPGNKFVSIEGNSRGPGISGQGVVNRTHTITNNYHFAHPAYPASTIATGGSLKALLQQVGFSGSALDIALGVVWGESNGDAKAVGDGHLVNSTWGPSYGLFQIRSLKNPSAYGYPDNLRIASKLTDPVYNASLAYKISNGGTNWQPWSVYTSGAYRRKLGVDGPIKNAEGQTGATAGATAAAGSVASASGGATAGAGSVASASGGTYKFPIKGKGPSSVGAKFGQRGSWSKYHTGIDIPAKEGTSIYSIAPGKVVYLNHDDGAWGKRMVVDHGNGKWSAYCHMESFNVTVGNAVDNDTVLGPVGMTGRTFGPHLHFELWNEFKPRGYADGHEIDPMPFFGQHSDASVDGASVDTDAAEASTSSDMANIAANIVFHALYRDPVHNELSEMLTGERALLNDVSLMPAVKEYTSAGMRSFQSAPNGDFLAFYPDYFGQAGTSPKLQLEDIELVDFSIQLDDTQLTTHVFAVGDYATGDRTITNEDILNSTGVVTIDQKFVLEKLVNGTVEGYKDGQELARIFGARPLKREYSHISNPLYEFMLAIQLFQQKWAEQFATATPMTFMPELYPGMRVSIKSQDLVVYVEGVTHNFSRSDGFTTDATFSSPASISGEAGMVKSS